jgi:hypothetical protein
VGEDAWRDHAAGVGELVQVIDFGMPSWAAIEADARERAMAEASNRFRDRRNSQWNREIDQEQEAKATPAQPPEARRTLRYGSRSYR